MRRAVQALCCCRPWPAYASICTADYHAVQPLVPESRLQLQHQSADAASITDNIRDSLAKPGFKIEYEEFMDRDSGDIRSMPTGVEGDPLAGPVLLFGALATRFGGLVPDEMPFNIVQKFLRGILPKGAFPDYADDDFRKNFQDTWYGTNIQMTDKLPEFMRSRPSTWAPTMNNSTETESEQESVVAQDDASV